MATNLGEARIILTESEVERHEASQPHGLSG
jgi:hypothetical protein